MADGLSESKIKQVKECVEFFGVENAASMCNLSIEKIKQIVAGSDGSTGKNADEQSGQASRPSGSQSEKAADERFERSESRNIVERSTRRLPLKSSSRTDWSLNKQKLNDREYREASSYERASSYDRILSRKGSSRRSRSPARGDRKRVHIDRGRPDEQHAKNSIFDDNLGSGEDEASADRPTEGRWISTYINNAAEVSKSTVDNRDSLTNSYIFDAFKTLLKAKKTFINAEHVVSIFICNLMANGQDVFLYPNRSKFGKECDRQGNCLDISLCLTITSNGCKFRPAFLLDEINLKDRPSNQNVVLVESKRDYLKSVFKRGMEMNMIYRAVCLAEDEELYLDKEAYDLFDKLNCELIMIPGSLACQISPFQHSILLALNGIMHDLYLSSNKQFPTSLNEALYFFEAAWERLSSVEIQNAFNSTISDAFLSD